MRKISKELRNYITDHFIYEPETGAVLRNYAVLCRDDRGRITHHEISDNWRVINVAPNSNGYLAIDIYLDGRRYNMKLHHICWFLYYGTFPKKEIDHANRVKTDNIITNLREASGSQNQINRSRQINNTSGFKGVHLRKDNFKYRVYITFNRERIWLGQYETAEEGAHQYDLKAKELFGEFAYLNFPT